MSVLSVTEERVLSLQLDNKDTLDANLLEMLRSTGFTSCVPIKYSSKKKVLRYDLDGLMSFKARLASVMTVDEFYLLLHNFYQSLFFVFESGHQVHPSKIDWDADLVFIDTKGRVQFVVYPLERKTVEGVGIFHFLSQVIKNVKPFGKVDEDGFNRLRKYLEPVLQGSYPREEFIHNLANEVKGYHNANLSGYKPEMLKALVQGIDYVHKEKEEKPVVETFGSVNLNMTYISSDVSEKTSFLGIDDVEDNGSDKTQVLSEEVENYNLIGYLKRSGGELYTLDYREGVDTWVFGKKPDEPSYSTDKAIRLDNNKFISRNHMKIEFEASANKFYLSDLGSSNGTYVDGVKCSSAPVELLDGSIIKLSGEEMTFTIREV